MKNSNIKRILTIHAIALFATGAIVLLYFSYDIISMKSRNETEAAYWGAIIGSALVGLIAIMSLIFTLLSNNKNRQETNKLQSSLKVEENFTHGLRKISKEITTAYNQLEIMLLIMRSLKVGEGGYSLERNNLIEVYSKFRTAINGIRLNTQIYKNLSKCEGCTACHIKTYGELAKETMALQKCFIQIDKECTDAFNGLETVLSIAMDLINIPNLIDMRRELNRKAKDVIDTLNKRICTASEKEKAELQNEIDERNSGIIDNKNKLNELEKKWIIISI